MMSQDKVQTMGVRRHYVVSMIDKVVHELTEVLKICRDEEKPFGKREQNRLTKSLELLEATRIVFLKEIAPKEPRTIDDAIAYLRSKKKDGTYLALLTEKGELIRTVFLTPKQLSEVPKHEIRMTPIQMQMQKIELVIATLDFAKPIPKKAKGFVTLAKNGKEIKRLK